MSAFRQLWAILRKDILLELRTKEMIVSMILFAMLTMVVFNYTFSAEKNDLTKFGGGMLWLAFIFTAFLGLNRSFVHEKDEGCLDGLLISPVDRSVIFIAKMLGNLIFISIVEFAAVPLFTIFFISFPFYAHLDRLWLFVLGLMLGNFGVAGVGTFVATLAVNTKRRDLLLPIVGLPLLMPVLAPAVIISSAMMGGAPIARTAETTTAAVKILAVYDIVFFAVMALIYDAVLGE